MNPLKWLLEKLGLIKEKEEATPVEIERITELPEEIKELIPKECLKGYKYFEGYRIRWKPPRKIRGFKPKTAHEKRLWKPNAKLEEED